MPKIWKSKDNYYRVFFPLAFSATSVYLFKFNTLCSEKNHIWNVCQMVNSMLSTLFKDFVFFEERPKIEKEMTSRQASSKWMGRKLHFGKIVFFFCPKKCMCFISFLMLICYLPQWIISLFFVNQMDLHTNLRRRPCTVLLYFYFALSLNMSTLQTIHFKILFLWILSG